MTIHYKRISLSEDELSWIISILDASPRAQENPALMCELCSALSDLEDERMEEQS